jgi:hypothetical protein
VRSTDEFERCVDGALEVFVNARRDVTEQAARAARASGGAIVDCSHAQLAVDR